MSAQEYIASGLLEAYVFGILPEAEAAEIQQAIAQYPEVKAEVEAIEEAMFDLGTAGAVAPPSSLKEDIWNTIQQQGQSTDDLIVDENPTVQNTSIPVIPRVTDTIDRAHTTIPLTSGRSYGWAFAASLALLVGSLAANYVQMGKNNDMSAQVALLEGRMDTLSKSQQQMAALVNRYQTEAELISDGSMKKVLMQTQVKDHPMAATIYWSKDKAEAYISVQKLPMPPEGMQYQLWAIADGKPVDLGVLSNDMIGKLGMEKVGKKVIDGQAFAISLEKAGGSPTPSMDKIQVLGVVAG